MMKLLKFASLVTVVLAASGIRGQEGGFDHERLTTVDGRTYHEIFVVGSDENGLTFRHRSGIAKVGFEQLSEAYRMLYEAVSELPGEPASGIPAAPGPEAEAPADWADTLDREPVVLLARNRTVIELPASWQWLGGGVDHDFRVPAWPVWWPDHARVHRLTHPLYRELAVRDFLYTSGLLPWPGHW